MRCALEAAAVRVAPSMNAQDVANTLWALATLGWTASTALTAVLEQRVGAFESSPTLMSTLDLSQLLQAHLASQFLGLGLITLPSSMLQAAVQAYREEARKVTVSNGQREVGESLRRLDMPHELEYITQTGCSASILRSSCGTNCTARRKRSSWRIWTARGLCEAKAARQ